MKRAFIYLIALLLLFALTACGAESSAPDVSSGGQPSRSACFHQSVIKPAAEPDCTKTGLTEGACCALCGECLIEQREIPAYGHKPGQASEREATCDEAGVIGQVKCEVCGAVIEEEKNVPALGHTTDNGVCERCGLYIGGIWETRYYVDEFDQPTNEWYISSKELFIGKFSNSATTNSKLTVKMLIDKDDITIFLYEYDMYPVKNPWSSADEYDITIRTSSGDKYLTGTMYSDGDRIFIDSQHISSVIQALRGGDEIMFHIASENMDTYLFSVMPANFADEYDSIMGNSR